MLISKIIREIALHQPVLGDIASDIGSALSDLISEQINKLWAVIRGLIGSWMRWGYEGLFDNINGQVNTIAAEVSKTPGTYNSHINGLIEKIAENVIMPVGLLIITAIFCSEIINIVMEKNAMNEMGHEFFFRYLGKACIAVLLLSYTFDISEAIFDLGGEIASQVVSESSQDITASNVDIDFILREDDDDPGLIQKYIEETKAGYVEVPNKTPSWDDYKHGMGELIGMALEATALRFVLLVMYVIIKISLIGRMIEIYMVLAVAPIPFATLTNREWGNIGTNYIRKLAALAFQSFFIIIAVVIYAALVTELSAQAATLDLSSATLELVGGAIALTIAIRGSKSLSESVLGAH